MTYNKYELAHAKTLSQQLPCSIPGCSAHRLDLSNYCRKHYLRQRNWGSAHAQKLGGRYFRPFDARVAELISLNRSHPAVTTALAFIDRWLESAGRGQSNLARGSALRGEEGRRVTQLGRALYDQRKTSEEILTRAASVWLAAIEENYILNVRHQDTQTGYRVQNLIKKSKGQKRGCQDRGKRFLTFAISSTHYLALGRYLRAGLSNSLVNIAFSTKLKREEDTQRAVEIRKPMERRTPPQQ
jgi:hypothetical protein